jgi:hypothetical protein
MREIGAALLAVALLTGCGGGYDGDFWLCFTGPKFETDALPGATVGQQYTAFITAEVAAEPDDDAYEYSFMIDGPLPPGLQVLMPYGKRNIQFIGVPQTSGTYNFTVSVSVHYRNGAQVSLCWDTSDRSYQIVVSSSQSG